MRKERLSRGWSIHEFARRTGLNAGHLSRIENGKRPPTENVAAACDVAFPERRGWFTEYYEELRYVFTDEETVSALAVVFDSLRGECYKVSESAALLERMCELWATGVSPLTRVATADPA
jgi:hypothetical protein